METPILNEHNKQQFPPMHTGGMNALTCFFHRVLFVLLVFVVIGCGSQERKLDNYIYHLPNPEDFGIKTHMEALKYMEKLGFRTNKDNNKLVKNVDEVDEFYSVRHKRPNEFQEESKHFSSPIVTEEI